MNGMSETIVLAVTIALILNLVTFAMYGIDKWKAKRDRWRIPESTLLGAAAICPWGALTGMYLFRHKTLKPKFKIVWLFAIVHLVLAIVVYLSLGQ